MTRPRSQGLGESPKDKADNAETRAQEGPDCRIHPLLSPSIPSSQPQDRAQKGAAWGRVSSRMLREDSSAAPSRTVLVPAPRSGLNAWTEAEGAELLAAEGLGQGDRRSRWLDS